MNELKDVYFEKDGQAYSIFDIPPDPEILRRAQEYDRKTAKAKRKRKGRCCDPARDISTIYGKGRKSS